MFDPAVWTIRSYRQHQSHETARRRPRTGRRGDAGLPDERRAIAAVERLPPDADAVTCIEQATAESHDLERSPATPLRLIPRRPLCTEPANPRQKFIGATAPALTPARSSTSRSGAIVRRPSRSVLQASGWPRARCRSPVSCRETCTLPLPTQPPRATGRQQGATGPRPPFPMGWDGTPRK